jgi:hypothetical protein
MAKSEWRKQPELYPAMAAGEGGTVHGWRLQQIDTIRQNLVHETEMYSRTRRRYKTVYNSLACTTTAVGVIGAVLVWLPLPPSLQVWVLSSLSRWVA